MKTGLLLIQLGSPDSPSVPDVKKYLRQFLGDKRVVDNGGPMWPLILNLFILPSRSPKSAHAYASIWDGQDFPLIKHTRDFTEALRARPEMAGIPLETGYIIGRQSVGQAYKKLLDQGCTKIRVIPLFPQFSETTTLSCKDCLDAAIIEHGAGANIDFVEDFHAAPAYIDALVAKIDAQLAAKPAERLVLSFHGLPIRRIRCGDRYFDQCAATAALIRQRLKNIDHDSVILSFQSRFGRERWLEPSTEETLKKLAAEGVKSIAIACPAFTADNLETLEEIGMGLKEMFLKEAGAGSSYDLVPCLNADADWIAGFVRDVALPSGGTAHCLPPCDLPKGLVMDQGCCAATKHCPACPYKGLAKHPDGSLSPGDRKNIKAIFLTLFLDLVGFAIIIPLFPAMLKHYEATEGAGTIFRWLMDHLTSLTGVSDEMQKAALLGGALGGLYSFLQFLLAPLVGSISDRVGRKKVLTVSIFLGVLGYLTWGFAGSFALLLVSRVLCGISGSNISTATAAVADITSAKTRSVGMASIGIAFGLGFTFGPAIGALSAMWDPTKTFPGLVQYGLNPFSIAAFVAMGLSLLNLYWVRSHFTETLSEENRGKAREEARTVNPLKLFHSETYPGVTGAIWTNALFLIAFGGAEQMLTFLTDQRLGYGHGANGLMFLFIGIMLSLVQGGYVRRKAPIVGEKKMAFRGLALLIPSMLLIALAGQFKSTPLLFLGLTFMVVGSAFTIPCITALCSIYTPSHDQGRVMGHFRSLGALARAIGPAVAGLAFCKFGFTGPYLLAALMLLVPLFIVKGLPEKGKPE